MFLGLVTNESKNIVDESLMSKGPESRNEQYFRVRRIGENGKHLTLELRSLWIDEAAGRDEKFTIQCIFGELRSIDVIEKGLGADNCEAIEVIFGPKVDNGEIKGRLETILKGAKAAKLKLLSVNERPTYHALRIGDHYLYEDRHPVAQPYLWATAIPHAGDDTRQAFASYFDALERESKPYTAENIGELQTYR